MDTPKHSVNKRLERKMASLPNTYLKSPVPISKNSQENTQTTSDTSEIEIESSDSTLNSCVSLFRNFATANSNTEMLSTHLLSDSNSRVPAESESEIDASTLIVVGRKQPNFLVDLKLETHGITSSANLTLSEPVVASSSTSSVEDVHSSSISSVQEVYLSWLSSKPADDNTSNQPSSAPGEGSVSSEQGMTEQSDSQFTTDVDNNTFDNTSQKSDDIYDSTRSKIVVVVKPKLKFDMDSPIDPDWKAFTKSQQTLRWNKLKKKSRPKIVFDSIKEEEEYDFTNIVLPSTSQSVGSDLRPNSMDADTCQQYFSQKNILSAPLSGIVYKTDHKTASQSQNPSTSGSENKTTVNGPVPLGSGSDSQLTAIPSVVKLQGMNEPTPTVSKIRNATMTNRPKTQTQCSLTDEFKSKVCKAIQSCTSEREYIYISKLYGSLVSQFQAEGNPIINVLFERGYWNYAESTVEEDMNPQEKVDQNVSNVSSYVLEEATLSNLTETKYDDDFIIQEIMKHYKVDSNSTTFSLFVNEKDKTYETLMPFVPGNDGSRPSEFTEVSHKFNSYFRRQKALLNSYKTGTLGPNMKSSKTKSPMLRKLKPKWETPEVYKPIPPTKEFDKKAKPRIQIPHVSYGRPKQNGIGIRNSTPMIKLHKVPGEYNVECEIVLKCEYINTTGIASYPIISELLEHNENINVINKDFTIVCPKTISAGLGVALSCAEKGYQPPIIILSDNTVSTVDVNLLLSLGAKVVRCPTDKTGVTSNDKADEICKKLLNLRSKTWKLNFDHELKNSFKHCFSSGREILEQCKGNADLLICDGDSALLLKEIASEMTGIGSISGKCQIVAVETDPCVRRGSHVNYWYPYSKNEGMVMARKLIRDEGILCGAIGGSLVDCALKAAVDFNIHMKKEARIVVLFPGGLAQGDKEFLEDQWMIDKNCWLEPDMECFHYWWWDLPLSIIKIKEAVTVHCNLSVRKALYIMEACHVDRLVIIPVSDGSQQNCAKAVLTKGVIINYLKEQEHQLVGGNSWKDRSVDLDNILIREITCDPNILTTTVFMKLKDVSKAFKTYHFLVIVQREDVLFYKANILNTGQLQNVVGVVSPLDVLQYKKSVMEDHRKRFGMILKG